MRLRRPSGVEHDRPSISAETGVCGAGAHDHRVAGGDRRRDLVRDEEQRKVERRDAGDRAERHAADVRLALLGARQPVERHDLALGSGVLSSAATLKTKAAAIDLERAPS